MRHYLPLFGTLAGIVLLGFVVVIWVWPAVSPPDIFDVQQRITQQAKGNELELWRKELGREFVGEGRVQEYLRLDAKTVLVNVIHKSGMNTNILLESGKPEPFSCGNSVRFRCQVRETIINGKPSILPVFTSYIKL